jgi:hypothetical protein
MEYFDLRIGTGRELLWIRYLTFGSVTFWSVLTIWDLSSGAQLHGVSLDDLDSN